MGATGDKKIKALFKGDKNHPLTDRSLSSYLSYLNRVPKTLGIKESTFYKITSVERLLKMQSELYNHPSYKKIAPNTQEHIRSVLGKYIGYTEKMRQTEKLSDHYIKSLLLSFKRNKELADTKKLKRLLSYFSFVDDADSDLPKFNKTLCAYFGIESEKELKAIYRTNRKYHSDDYYSLILTEPDRIAKLLAMQAHYNFLKSRAN